MNLRKLIKFTICSVLPCVGFAISSNSNHEVKAEMSVTNSTITNIHVRDAVSVNNSNNLFMGFWISDVDYTTNNKGFNYSLISNYNFLDNIKIYTNDNCYTLASIYRTNNIVTHAWGDPMINIGISNSNNLVTASTIKYVEILEGTTFPNENANGAYKIPYTVLKNAEANPSQPGWSTKFNVISNPRLITYKNGTTIVGYDFATEGSEIELPNISSTPGYESIWSSADVTIKNNKFTVPNKNVVFSSEIKKSVYTITYNLDGGIAVNPETYSIDTETFSLNAPSKEGYEFLGWTTKTQKTPSPVYTITKGSTGNLELSANYKIKTFNFVFDPNNGDATTSLIVNYGTIISSADMPETPSYEGYTFAGWYLNNEKYDFTSPIKTDVEVKARWTNFYTVSFSSGEGASKVSSIVVEANTKIPENVVPTKPNATFEGWLLNGNIFDLENTLITSDISLTAKWTENAQESEKKNGCNGSLIACGGLISLFALSGASILIFKKKEN